MNINDAYPSKYLKASDLPIDGSLAVTIEKIALEDLGRDKETKPVIYFVELERGMICNKTNARTIARILASEEFDDWISRRIGLYRTEVEFGGDMYEAIRVKGVKTPAKPAAPAAAAKRQPVLEPDEGDIPF